MQEGTTDFVFAPENTSMSASSNRLQNFRNTLLQNVLNTRDRVRSARKSRGYVEWKSVLEDLRAEVKSS